MLRSDVDAIARDPAEVEARLLSQRADRDAMRAWARALRALRRNSHIWQGRIPATLLERYLALAEHRDRADAPQQLAMFHEASGLRQLCAGRAPTHAQSRRGRA